MRLGTLISRRFSHNCVGCGRNLVKPTSRSSKILSPASFPSVQAQANEKIQSLLNQFSEHQIEALNWTNSGSNTIESFELRTSKVLLRAEKALKSEVCKPCVMARNGTISPIEIPEPPKNVLGTIFRVIDALDFPLGIPFDRITNSNPLSCRNEVFVINRCDLLVSHASQLSKLKCYFMQNFFNKYSISPDQVILVSATKKWHLNKLSEMFTSRPNQNSFVGSTLAGKTRLIHEMCGITQNLGATCWPLPFTTQKSTQSKTLPEYRAKILTDTPSESQGSSAITHILPSVLRKACSGIKMCHKDPKYSVPVVKIKTGQVVSIGGLVALEFPRLDTKSQVSIHVFAGIGGLAHTEYARPVSSMEKLREINASKLEHHLKMRMHDNIELQLEPKLKFYPQSVKSTEKESVVIKNLGFLQPYVFGTLPPNYEATVWAPQGTDVGLRPEILSHL